MHQPKDPDRHPLCPGCQFGPQPDYARGSREDVRAHHFGASLERYDIAVCHRRDTSDPHYDPKQTAPYACGGVERLKDARRLPGVTPLFDALLRDHGGRAAVPEGS